MMDVGDCPVCGTAGSLRSWQQGPGPDAPAGQTCIACRSVVTKDEPLPAGKYPPPKGGSFPAGWVFGPPTEPGWCWLDFRVGPPIVGYLYVSPKGDYRCYIVGDRDPIWMKGISHHLPMGAPAGIPAAIAHLYAGTAAHMLADVVGDGGRVPGLVGIKIDFGDPDA